MPANEDTTATLPEHDNQLTGLTLKGLYDLLLTEVRRTDGDPGHLDEQYRSIGPAIDQMTSLIDALRLCRKCTMRRPPKPNSRYCYVTCSADSTHRPHDKDPDGTLRRVYDQPPTLAQLQKAQADKERDENGTMPHTEPQGTRPRGNTS